MSCLLQDQFHLLKVAQFTNWGLQRSLTSRPSVCTSISSSAKAYFPQSDCCFEHKALLLYFYVSHTHSRSTRHKVCSQKYMEIHRAEELPAVVCVVRIHFILPFPSPVQSPPVSRLPSGKTVHLSYHSEENLPGLPKPRLGCSSSHRIPQTPFKRLAARLTQRQITLNQES